MLASLPWIMLGAMDDVAKVTRGFALTDAAVARLKSLASQQADASGGLRLAIQGGGCSGLMYVMDWVPAPKEKDKVFEQGGARVFIDPRSFLLLNGSELHYEESLMSAGFKVRNPNTKSSCGCGESFSV
jgi:iron-sulfur cluster assembly protein